MRLAFYTYSYTDRMNMSIAECLARIAKTGYWGIDVSGTHGKSADPKSFDAARRKLTRQTAEKHRLRIEAVITHAQLTDSLTDKRQKPLDLKGSIDLAAELASPVVTFHMGGYPQGGSRDALRKKVVAVIREAADYGAARHVSLAVDGIWPTWINDSPDAMQRLFDDVDSVNFSVNFDPCYLTLMGVDPVVFCKRFARRIAHAHLKDHRGKYPKWKHLMPGQGEMDYSRVFKALAETRFEGAAAVECFTDMPFDKACDSCYLAMQDAARKAGVKFSRG